MQRGWSIAGNCGLYTGWNLTRAEAIAQHVSCYEDVSEFALGGKLNEAQLRAWTRCKVRGDRAVKIEIRATD